VPPRDRIVRTLVLSLLDWFRANARDLPWRHTLDPYAIWVSEIMLQQTQVKTVVPYWERWMRELPDVPSLSHASLDTLHKLWEGLGYYTRVKNMQRAAQVILDRHGGKLPQDLEGLLALPGIGRYTAGAIASIAFNQPAPIVDGNVARVLTRTFGIEGAPNKPETNRKLWQLAETLVRAASPEGRPGSTAARSHSFLNQSLMELGALVCIPRDPHCDTCPLHCICIARLQNRVAELPNKAQRPVTTPRHFAAFVTWRRGRVLLRQRPGGVVNAHFWEFPNIELPPNVREIRADGYVERTLGSCPVELKFICAIQHSITRYRITLSAYEVRFSRSLKGMLGKWLTPGEVDALALTGAHRKVWRRLSVGASRA
jgi:A/G-specific adenine glycosylase